MKEHAIQYRVIHYDSEDYHKTLPLRDVTLRQPWGQSIADDDLSSEADDYIYGAFDGDRLIGMSVLQEGESFDRLRYMAVDEQYRHCGIGSVIARHFEAIARQKGKAGIRLMARTSVIGFYEALGYVAEGERFYPDHIDVEHQYMRLYFS